MGNIAPLNSNRIFSDTEQDILEEIQTRILIESQGTLDDFSPASPLSALSEGQAYAATLLGETLNKIPDEVLLKFFQVVGLNRTLARNSIVGIEFTRTNGFTASDVVIPEGFRMFTADGLVFTLDEKVILSKDVQQAIGYATSVGVGKQFNVQANTITGYSLSLPGLSSITNPEPARGGSNNESNNQALSRGLSFLQFRHLTTSREYEIAAASIIGEDYAIKAYSYFEVQDFLYQNDSLEYIPAFRDSEPLSDYGRRNVYLVCSNNQGESLPVALQNKVKNYISPRIQSGSEVIFISPEPLQLDIVVKCANNPSDISMSNSISSVRLNQSVLYKGIGKNFSTTLVKDLLSTFYSVQEVIINQTDSFGNIILQYSSNSSTGLSIPAPTPNVVWFLGNITIVNSNGTEYLFSEELVDNGN